MTLGDILELIHQMLTDGITWATLISVFLVIHKIIEGNKKRAAYERLEKKVDAIMQNGGVEWQRAENPGSISYHQKLRNLLLSFLADIYLALHAKQFTKLKEMKNVQVNKIWLIAFIAYLGGIIGKQFGVTFSDEVYNEMADFVIIILLPIIGFALDKFKQPKETPPIENNK